MTDRVAVLETLVFALGDKLLIVAEHLGRLAERPEARSVQSGHQGQAEPRLSSNDGFESSGPRASLDTIPASGP